MGAQSMDSGSKGAQVMGKVVGAAIVSHHPGLFQCDEFRLAVGNGVDSDLIAGYGRVRERLDAARPDVLVIVDSHWFTTGYHLADGGKHYKGRYISDEMPWYLFGKEYDYPGCPELAFLVEQVGRERAVHSRAIADSELGRQYATINIVNKLRRDERVMSLSCCQNCRPEHYLQSGEVLGEAIRRSGLRVAMSPRIFDEVNVSRPENVASDKLAIEWLQEGRHDRIIDEWDARFRKLPWEAFGGHYLQMVGAIGGRECRAVGAPLSAYENARGTGNIHIWFDLARGKQHADGFPAHDPARGAARPAHRAPPRAARWQCLLGHGAGGRGPAPR
jgi:3,4-dihydroxyphenylacetate 2,3-dioxygenase